MQHVSLIRFSDLAKCYIRIALYDGKFLTDLFKRSVYPATRNIWFCRDFWYNNYDTCMQDWYC